MLKWKRVCHTLEAFYFCQSGHFVFAAYNNILEFEMKGGDVMVLKFFVKTDKDGNEINSWYYETWKRVKMPPVYPKDLVR